MGLFDREAIRPRQCAAAAGIDLAEGLNIKSVRHCGRLRQLMEPQRISLCASAGARYAIRIRNGGIDHLASHAGAEDETPLSIKGFVTSDGFVAGGQETGRGLKLRFEANIEESDLDADLLAGVLARGDNCTRVVALDER